MRTELEVLADENDGLSGIKEWDRVERCDSEDDFESGSDEESQIVDEETSELGESSWTPDSTDCEHGYEALQSKPEIVEEIASNEEGTNEVALNKEESFEKTTDSEYGASEEELESDSGWNLLS